ncbi:MAG: DUF2277 domain-containing protein [Pseudomonadota bacterium]
MCRNIRPLFNLALPSTEQDAREAALQFVRKVAGTRTPSKRNQPAFEAAVEAISAEVWTLVNTLETHAPPRRRTVVSSRTPVPNPTDSN